MASSVIGALRVNLGLDSAQFNRGATVAGKRSDALKGKFLALAKSMAGPILAMGSLAGAMGLIRKGAGDIDAAAKAARRLDTSIGGLRALQQAATEAGVPLSAVTDNVQNINRELAKGGKATTAALEKLGLSASELVGLDADEKIATIADRIKDLGLSSGDATAVLQGLGVRSREMLLLFKGGGDAIRNARKDIDEYGLALDSVEAAKIEAANDAMGRLSLISTYLAQQLSLAFTPAMGAMATAMTESLREGGLLRYMIDGLVSSLGVVSRAVISLAAVFAGQMVVSLGAAALGVKGLGFSLLALRGAIIRTGFGALIVLAGELAYRFTKLVAKSGSFGEALAVLKEVAVETFNRIGLAFSAVPLAIEAGGARMAATFFDQLRAMAIGFQDFVNTISQGMNDAFGTSIPYVRGLGDGLYDLANDASGAARIAESAMGSITDAVTAPMPSLEALRTAVSAAGDEAGGAAGDVSDLDESLGNIGGGAGKGKGGKGSAENAAAQLTAFQQAVKGAKDEIGRLKAETSALAGSGASGFEGEDAVSYAQKQAELVTAAQESGVKVTPQLTAEIHMLASSYVNAAKEAEAAAKGITDVSDNAEVGRTSLANMFVEIGTGAKKPMDALRALVDQLIAVSLQKGALGLMSSVGGGFFSAVGSALTMPGNANGTNNWRGGFTSVNERGGEIMDLPKGTRIIPHDISKRIADGAANSDVGSGTINVNVTGANGDQHVIALVQEGVSRGLSAFDQQLPSRVKQISNDPRAS
jgi:hypothetical protein